VSRKDTRAQTAVTMTTRTQSNNNNNNNNYYYFLTLGKIPEGGKN